MKKKLPPGLSSMKEKLATIAMNIIHKKKTLKKYQQLANAAKNLEEKDPVIHGNLKTLSGEYNRLSYNYRHMHIAYCELRGKRRKHIESQPLMRKLKPVSEELIEKFKAEYAPAA